MNYEAEILELKSQIRDLKKKSVAVRQDECEKFFQEKETQQQKALEFNADLRLSAHALVPVCDPSANLQATNVDRVEEAYAYENGFADSSYMTTDAAGGEDIVPRYCHIVKNEVASDCSTQASDECDLTRSTENTAAVFDPGIYEENVHCCIIDSAVNQLYPSKEEAVCLDISAKNDCLTVTHNENLSW
uniref:Uncharacterized protein n=1 Tax=Panagrolaimus sp. ES5 TaxID=591445 RepID=A0AC34GN17_9BILA